MYFHYRINDIDVLNIFRKIEPFLCDGAVLISSSFNFVLFQISPTPIKHISIVQKENNNWFIVEINDKGFLKEDIFTFIKKKNEFFLCHFKDEAVMHKTIEFVDKYKNITYGFTDGKQYCFEFVVKLYKDAFSEPQKAGETMFPSFKILGRKYYNSLTFMNSNFFLLKCSVINRYYCEFN